MKEMIKKLQKDQTKGFTLVEIIVVLVILAILAAIADTCSIRICK